MPRRKRSAEKSSAGCLVGMVSAIFGLTWMLIRLIGRSLAVMWNLTMTTRARRERTLLFGGAAAGMAVLGGLGLSLANVINPPPTPTPTLTATATKPPTLTASSTSTDTATLTPTVTLTATVTLTHTITLTPTNTLTPTITLTPTQTIRPTITRWPTLTTGPVRSGPIIPIVPAGCDCGRDYDCGDFSSHSAAQACYDQCGGNNWSRLDNDHDGLACEN